MMTNKLTKNKKKWVKQFKPTALRGKPLHNNAAIAIRYKKRLTSLVQKMTKTTLKEIEKLYKTPNSKEYFAMDASITSQARILLSALNQKFNEMFGRSASLFAEDMVSSANKQSIASLSNSLSAITGGMTVNTKVMSADLHETIKASVQQNVSLIKSISSEYLTKVEGAVMRSITTGQGLFDLIPQIEQIGGVTERKAKNIALDQTRKAYNSINTDRMKKVGVQKFEWLHSGGGLHPRQDHIELSGQIFSFDNLPIIDKKTGERGIPGQLPHCGCVMIPVIVFDDGTE